MDKLTRLISIAVIFTLFMLAILCIATRSAKAWIDLPSLTTETIENECIIEFANNTNRTYILWLKWIDHPHLNQTKGKPWVIVCAEMKPKELFNAGTNREPGLYTITIQEQHKSNLTPITRRFTIMPETKKVVIAVVILSPMQIPIITLDFTPTRPIGGSKPG